MKKHNSKKKHEVVLAESRGTEREDYLSTLRDNVRKFMDECGYTMDELAEIADMPLSTFRDFIYGNTATVKITPIIRLAKEFGISIDELVGADTLPAETKESLQILRRLPEHFSYFFRWSIRATERHRNRIKPKGKAVSLLHLTCEDGSLKPSNDFDLIDISDIPLDKRAKIFMGIKIPCDHYMPLYSPYHVLLIANDRHPRPSEVCLIASSGSLWLVKLDKGKFYSLRDGKYRCDEDYIDELVGYVAATKILEVPHD